MRTALTLVLSVMCVAGLCGLVVAGNLDSAGAPSSGSGMYSLSQIYNYLNSGIKATPVPSFQEPGAAPGPTMKTTKEIYDNIVAKLDQCNATALDVGLGKTFFSTASGSWGVQTGTLTQYPETPSGWSGACVWQVGSIDCPSNYPYKHTRTVCTSYGVSGGGAHVIMYSSGSIIGSCSGQGCSTGTFYGGNNLYKQGWNDAGVGVCTLSTIYTYCCR